MRLFYYEHCPFCIRTLMTIGYKKMQSDIERIVLSNDDEQMPMRMIGKKMLPILEKKSGEFLPESLDIVNYLDHVKPEPRIEPFEVTQTQQQIDAFMPIYKQLVFPRMPQPRFMEFQTPESRAYFTRKKEAWVGNFEDCLQRTASLVQSIGPYLEQLSHQLHVNETHLTQQDIYLYPWIYLLQVVKELTLPTTLKSYLKIKMQQIDPLCELLVLNQFLQRS